MTITAVFSSNQEEPIIMSATALATLQQNVHFSEEEEDDIMSMEVQVHSPHVQPSFRWPDTSSSTSALTRHSLKESFPIAQFLGLILQDYLTKFTQLALKSPLRSPILLQRILQLIWHGGPRTHTHTTYNYRQLQITQQASNFSTQLQRSIHPASVHGIRNYGQTCFLNSVLQSFASLDSIIAYAEWIARQQQEEQAQKRFDYQHTKKSRRRRLEKPTQTTTVSELLLPLLQSLNGQSKDKQLDPRDLLWRVAQKNPQFQTQRHLFGGFGSATGEQQDAQELLQALLEMMIVDANLEDSYTQQQSSQPNAKGLNDYFKEEKKDDEDDEVLTVLSDRWSGAASPRNSSNNSLCSSVEDEQNNNNNKTPSTYQMIDPNGMIASYENIRMEKQPYGLSSSLMSSNPSSLSSSFLSTTSTVVTSPAREYRQHQQHTPSPQPLSGSMQIMLSTISSITKTPLSCWTGSLVQCQACHHNKAVRNQEWRDIPVVPTALSTAPTKLAAQAPPCTLKDCLRNFTQLERVSDVECGNCTLQKEIRHWKEEVEMMREAVQFTERRNSQEQSAGGLRQELDQAELKLWRLQQQDPDEYDPNEEGQGKQMLRAGALKCLVLTRLPSVLCLHVQRRYYDPLTNGMSKTTQHVIFEELLDVAPYCAYGGGNANAQSFFAVAGQTNTTKPIWYRLASVIVHQGNAFGGHYVCYRRLPAHLSSSGSGSKNSQWYYCSDEVVHPTSWDQVQRAQAYMLFYEAI